MGRTEQLKDLQKARQFIALRIQAEIQLKGWTQKQLVQEINKKYPIAGVTQASISHIVNAKVLPGLPLLFVVLSTLEMDVDKEVSSVMTLLQRIYSSED